MLKRFIGQSSFVVAVLAIALATALTAAAQGSSAGLSGTITGPDGKPLANAQVTITRLDIPATYTVKTNKKGQYGYYTLPVGMYKVAVKGPDGKEYTVNPHIRTSYSAMVVASLDLKKAVEAAQAASYGMAPPPPGMNAKQRAAYEAKIKAQADATKKVNQLNVLLKENKADVQAKQYTQAVAVMEQAVALDQTHDILYANLAEDYQHTKQYDKAAAAYEKAIALAPTNASYVINLGNVLNLAGKTDQANAEFAKAAKMDPAAANTALYNSAVLLLNKGNLPGAAAAFDKVIAVDPTNANAWYYKGICLLGTAQTGKNGQIIAPPGAAAALEQALKLAPTGPNAANAKAALQTLGVKN